MTDSVEIARVAALQVIEASRLSALQVLDRAREQALVVVEAAKDAALSLILEARTHTVKEAAREAVNEILSTSDGKGLIDSIAKDAAATVLIATIPPKSEK